MVRRLANSRNNAKNEGSLSIPGPSAEVNNAVLTFNAPESQGLRALFAGFIDLYCESIPELRRAHLKNELRSLLVQLGVVPEFFFSDDLGPVRLVCSQLISDLVRSVLMRTEPPDNRSLFARPNEVFNQSRFRTEFEELETIGRGGFGHVYRVRSLLDRHEYAIKKIVARDDAEQLSQRILHEVQILAGLQHSNVVRYHCGWIEMERTPTSNTSSASSPPFTRNVPPRARKDSPRIAIQEIFDSTSDESSQPAVVQELENGVDGEGGGGEDSMASSVGAAVATQSSPVGGKFWSNTETSSESVETTSQSGLSSIAEDRRNGEMSVTSMSSVESALVQKKSPVGGRFWGAETSGESIEEESTEEMFSPVLATAIPVEKKKEEEGAGDGEWSEEEVESVDGVGGGGKQIAVMQLKVRMVIFIQMELCTSTLEKFLWKRNEQLRGKSCNVDGRECLALFRQLISAVEYIHEKGLIHRDIKPGNLFLKMDRQSSIHLLLGDFGLSCLDGDNGMEGRGGGGEGMIFSSGGGAKHSQGVGTTTYAAPEQMRTTNYGREVDLYSSGIVLLELFSIVHTTSERLAVIEALRERRELSHDVLHKWPSIASLVLRLTSPDPADRPTATAVLNELSEEASEIRSLRETVSNQAAEIAALRKEVKRLRMAMSERKKRGRNGESHSSC